MKRLLSLLLVFTLAFFTACDPSLSKPDNNGGSGNSGNNGGNNTELPEVARNGKSGISYQLLVYSFADSNGDGCGDFKGIESKLDYLKSLGVQALWLSPIHKSSSYHGYDVLDYTSIDPDFGTEDDFKSLVNSAHSKGIKIYLDYVINHTSKDHPWFLDAKSNADSKYRDYFIFSDNPQADIKAGKIPMIATEGASGYDAGQWFPAVSGETSAQKIKFTLTLNSSGKPATLKAEKTETISNSGSPSGIYLYYGEGEMAEFYRSGADCTLSAEISSTWGVLVRTSKTQWDSHKYGAPTGANQLEWGKPLTLSNTDSQDILLPGMSYTMYHSHFWTSYFADLNYGSVETCEDSEAFKAICTAADKWIALGIDGFRLDAIKHIYHNANNHENPTFLRKFYDYCNASYKKNGGKGEFYMVGEQFSAANEVAPYYAGLPAFFEFSFWWTLKDAINSGKGSTFVSTIQGFRSQYEKYRSNYIAATKLSNHDEQRAGSDLNRSSDKMKLAGAVLLTASGEPYIYQGEELGYYGVKDNGDEFVRTPIMWTADGKGLAGKRLAGKIDNAMLTSKISVESQEKDDNSVLSTYKKLGVLRDSYESLQSGSFEYSAVGGNNEAIAAWYRTAGTQKILVVHNFGATPIVLTVNGDKVDKMIGSSGKVSVKDNRVNLGSYSSALFLQ